MRQVIGLSHVRLSVPDAPEAARFYTEGLGLAALRESGRQAALTTPDGIALILTGGGTEGWDPGAITHVCYNTWDVDAAFRRALAFGAAPSRASDPEPYTYKDLRMAFVRTPSGEEIEFWGIMRPDGTFGEPMPGRCYVKNFVHVALTVPDMPAAVRFYEELGATLKVDWEWGCSMRLYDKRELELFTGGQYVEKAQAYTSFGFLAGAGREARTLKGLAGETIELVHPGEPLSDDLQATAPESLPELFADVPKDMQ